MSLRLISLILLIASIVTISSCQHDNEPKDNESPTIAFAQESQSRFTGTVDLTFDLKDNKSIARIEIFIDNNLELDKAISSASDTVNFQWDTKSFPDGVHRLKVVVTDTNGNLVEKTFDVKVRNILLTLTIPTEYFENYYDDIWIFLSDQTGQILGVKQAHNNIKLIFPMVAGFMDESIMVHIFKYEYENSDKASIIRLINSYPNVPIGDLVLTKHQPSSQGNDQGTIPISINDIPPGYTCTISGSGVLNVTDIGNYIEDSLFVLTPHIFGDETNILLVFYNNDGGRYLFLEHVKPGDEITTTFNSFKSMQKSTLSAIGSTNSFEIDGGYNSNANTADFIFYVSTPSIQLNPEQILTFYPESSLVTSYFNLTSTNYSGGTSETYYTRSTTPRTTFKNLDAGVSSFNFSNQQIKMSMNGDANTMDIISYKITDSEASLTSDNWTISYPFQQNIDFKMPVIPTEIASLYYPNDFPTDAELLVTLYKNDQPQTTYEDHIQQMFYGLSQPSTPDNYEFLSKSLVLSTGINSGRKSFSPYNIFLEKKNFNLPTEVQNLIQKTVK